MNKAGKVRLVVLDVDGTMTDGGVTYDAGENEFKKFAIKDGAGIFLGRKAGLAFLILTGRVSAPTERRARELKIEYVQQGVLDKRKALSSFMAEHRLAREEVAYCGDDLNDLAAMGLCGFVTCPADAAAEVKARADYICPQKGGEGAVRGAVEAILKAQGRWDALVRALESP